MVLLPSGGYIPAFPAFSAVVTGKLRTDVSFPKLQCMLLLALQFLLYISTIVLVLPLHVEAV